MPKIKSEKPIAAAPPPTLLKKIKSEKLTVAPDRLKQLRELGTRFRDLKKEKASLEERLSEINKSIEKMRFNELPEFMNECGVPTLGLEAEGNMPAVEFVKKHFYRANIPADWEPEKREEAFKYLDKIDAGDLIKTTIEVAFPREDRKGALAFARRVEKAGFTPLTKESVSWRTLTAWLRESVEKRKTLPDLEKIGGTVGHEVVMKEKA